MELQSQEIKELAAALCAAQSEFESAIKSTENTYFKSKYADLHGVVKACEKPLHENGFSWTHAINGDQLVTTLLHTSGQFLRAFAPIRPVKNDPQAFGSAVTYMRRYSLASLAGVVTEDDDGNAASETGGAKNKKDVKSAAALGGSPRKDIAPEEQAAMYDTAIMLIEACATNEAIDSIIKKYRKSWEGTLSEDFYADIVSRTTAHREYIANNGGNLNEKVG